MKQHNRVDQWRRNKANEHKLLIIRSTWDRAWTVIDYNSEISARKFGRGAQGWVEALAHARRIAMKRSIDRLSTQAMVGGDAA